MKPYTQIKRTYDHAGGILLKTNNDGTCNCTIFGIGNTVERIEDVETHTTESETYRV